VAKVKQTTYPAVAAKNSRHEEGEIFVSKIPVEAAEKGYRSATVTGAT
jgi:hypothetical protein